MAGRYIKVLFIIVITMFSLTISGCFYSPYSSYNAAFNTRGSTWKSSDPDIWFTVKEDGSTFGEFNYKGRVLKIQENYSGRLLFITLQESDGNEELEKIMNEKGGTLIRTTIQSCSDTKLVLKVDLSNLPDFKYTKIVFKRS